MRRRSSGSAIPARGLVTPPALVGWVRTGFALPVGSPVERVLRDGATVWQILDRVRQRVLGGADGWDGASRQLLSPHSPCFVTTRALNITTSVPKAHASRRFR